jgi:hypothetical protein
MTDLVAVAEQAVPGITAPFGDWPNAVVYARNISDGQQLIRAQSR